CRLQCLALTQCSSRSSRSSRHWNPNRLAVYVNALLLANSDVFLNTDSDIYDVISGLPNIELVTQICNDLNYPWIIFCR
ncbi:hypothetical protein BDP27DRAFT_1398278, partial [Rhodocollybia butyracea]